MDEPDAGRRLPEHVTTPLLTLITARSMDEDYAHVAQKRAVAGDARPRAVRPHWSRFLAIAALGVMAAVVAVQTDREAPANELAGPRSSSRSTAAATTSVPCRPTSRG